MGQAVPERLAELRRSGMDRLESLRVLQAEYPHLDLTIPETEDAFDQYDEVSTEVDTDPWYDIGGYEETNPDPVPYLAPELVDLIAVLVNRPAWQDDALCKEPHYQHLPWYPEPGQSTDECKAVCERCLCAEECAAYAIEIGAEGGVWAGASPKTLRKRNAA